MEAKHNTPAQISQRGFVTIMADPPGGGAGAECLT
jgi:hypothetical protein